MRNFLKSSFAKLLLLVLIVLIINFCYSKINYKITSEQSLSYILINIKGPFVEEGRVRINLTNTFEKITRNFLIKNNYKLRPEYRQYILKSKYIVENTINFHPFFEYKKGSYRYYPLNNNKRKYNGRKARYYK